MIGFIILMIIFGLIAGAVARLLVPGRDSMGVGATILLGIMGSFLGAVLVLLVWRAVQSRRGAGHRGAHA